MRPLSLVSLAFAVAALAQAGAAQSPLQPSGTQAQPKGQPAPKHAKAAPSREPTKAQLAAQTVWPAPNHNGSALLVAGSDDCSMASTNDAISGAGVFVVDNSLATTGAPVGSCGAIGTDVWFYWTSTSTGLAVINTCGQVSHDSVLAVWNDDGLGGPGSCPQTQIICNDDTCGLQSQVSFAATAGTSYFIELGSFAGNPGSNGTFTISYAVPPANDDCSTATAIAGLGTFAFDNTFATTSGQGQAEAACLFFGSTAIPQDVWFTWTSSVTGPVSLDTCASFVDTKIAVYAGAGCPAGAALACNDDACGFQTKVSWNAVTGQQYTIQVGLYPFSTTGGASSFTIAVPPPEDSCMTPISIAGTGVFNFDNTNATTGTEGQAEASCTFFGSTAVPGDVWYQWTSNFTGTAALTSCASSVDTKIAVYSGAGCPMTPALACNDDYCGFQSRVLWPVTMGSVYTIQIGLYPFGATGGPGTFDINQVVLPANDDCAMATAIAGAGPHAFDNSYATTGAQGQTEPLCLFFGNSAIIEDVWYTWTAGASGLHLLSLCAGTGIDSKVAVYDGAGCPMTPAIACNDDKCVLTSELCFSAVAGQQYTIQIGLYPNGGAIGGAGTFTVTPQVAGMTNDDCASATVIAGLGPHNYDNSLATTGCVGQDNGNCLFFGQTNIDNDVWFTWTAPASGQYELSLCGSPGGQDSKAAVYAGAGCPMGPAIACDDDGCGLIGGEALVCFNATGGAQYTIQIGNYPGAFGGPGAFQFNPVTPPTQPCLPADDGSTENAIGLTAGGAVGWLAGFGIIGQSTSVNTVETSYGSLLFPGGYVPSGPVTVAIWDDPNDDGDPSDAVLLTTVSAAVSPAAVDTDQFQSIPLGAPVVVNGIFFAGAVVSHPPGQLPMPLDQSSGGGGGCSAGPGSWVVGDTGGTLDLMSLLNNNVPLSSVANVGFPGSWLLRVQCAPGSTGTAYCFGDGTGTACPCGNNSTQAGTGCQHSFSAGSYGGGGALLQATGLASISNDSVQLQGSQMPPATTCLFFQGTASISVVFGDGLRCAGGTVTRMGQRPVSGGMRNFGAGIAGDPLVSVQGLVGAPGLRYYSIWFRNAAPFCTAATFNLSNGLELNWIP